MELLVHRRCAVQLFMSRTYNCKEATCLILHRKEEP
jgi:hypothetical protein